jgi:type III pantothenate kinase
MFLGKYFATMTLMLLTLDLGNTTITWGVFCGRKLIKFGRVLCSQSLPFKSFRRVKKVVVASVVPAQDLPLRALLIKRLKVAPRFLRYTDIPLNLTLKHKSEIGIDRLVDAYAAYMLYGGPLVVVDFGTATTFCAVTKNGVYLGGAIAPGIGIARDALHEKTAKLPRIKVRAAQKAIGKNTVQAMEAGIYLGYIGLVNELVARVRREMHAARPKVKVVATGGFAKLLSTGYKFDIINETLTLQGLGLIGQALKSSR